MNQDQMRLETAPALAELRRRTWRGMTALKMETDTPGQVRLSPDLWQGVGEALGGDPADLRVYGLPVRIDEDLKQDTLVVDSGGRVL